MHGLILIICLLYLCGAADVDLSTLTVAKGFKIVGADNDNYFGWSVSRAGDVNHDGVEDIIISARNAILSGNPYVGIVYVIFGRNVAAGASPFVNIQLPTTAMVASVGFRILGAASGDTIGETVSRAGDINGDGIDDIIVGAIYAGMAYVIFGRNLAAGATPFGDVQLPTTSMPANVGFRIIGVVIGDQCGFSVSAAGDVDGDGIDDLIVGAPYADPPAQSNAGITYVIFGRNIPGGGTAFGDIQLPSTVMPANVGFRILGAVAGDLSGFSVRGTGDVNGDGIDDVITGASIASACYVVFGRNIAKGDPLFGDIQLTGGNQPLLNSIGFRILGASSDDKLGFTVSTAGDINGDYIADIIVGAYRGDPPSGTNAGISYVILGRNLTVPGALIFGDIQLTNGATAVSAQGVFLIRGSTAGDESGYSVNAAGDVNGDGIGDVIVGAHMANSPNYIFAGASYVLFGRSLASGSISDVYLPAAGVAMDEKVGFRIFGASERERSGFSVGAAGDINNDGIDDIVVGAVQADPPSGVDAGISYIIYGAYATPSSQPSSQPSRQPSSQPSKQPSRQPSIQPSKQPSSQPSSQPSRQPTSQPSIQPNNIPTGQPSGQPSRQPSSQPTVQPTRLPSAQPSVQPSKQPSLQPTVQPSAQPSRQPSSQPSVQPSCVPTRQPSSQPSKQPSAQPTSRPSVQPSRQPVSAPSTQPSQQPTVKPSSQPSTQPSYQPSTQPSHQPLVPPSVHPTTQPSANPTVQPVCNPSSQPSVQPSTQPSAVPSVQPSRQPSIQPTIMPSAQPSVQPIGVPSSQPSSVPSRQPSAKPSNQPTNFPTAFPSIVPTSQPSTQPSSQPSNNPSMQPSSDPSSQPCGIPSAQPSAWPTVQPSVQPSIQPTLQPSSQPIALPSTQPSSRPNAQPSTQPSGQPTNQPSMQPSCQPSSQPSNQPSALPSQQPIGLPTCQPTVSPSLSPTNDIIIEGEWATALNNTNRITVLATVNNHIWACGVTGDVVGFCSSHDSGLGKALDKYQFPWSDVTSVVQTGEAASVTISGRSVDIDYTTSHIATCSVSGTQLVCSARSLVNTNHVAGSYVSSVKKIVYIGTYNTYASVSILNTATNVLNNYLYTTNKMRTVEFSHAQSPPNYVGSFLAGVCASAASVHYICAGVIRTDSGIMSSMYLTPTRGSILNSAELVNAMALEYVNPDSFIIGGLELSDGAGMHAYVLRVNSLYYSVLYGIRFRVQAISGRRALQGAQGASSVARCVLLVDTTLLLIADYTMQSGSTTNVAVLKVNIATRQITKQVHIYSDTDSLSCNAIIAAGLYYTMSCTVGGQSNQSQLVIISVDRDLTLAQLPSGFRRYENHTFVSEQIGFYRTMLPVRMQADDKIVNDYTFTTANNGPMRPPSVLPTSQPSSQPSSAPSGQPSSSPTAAPSVSPQPTSQPSSSGPTNTYKPTVKPTPIPSAAPTTVPTLSPSVNPTTTPTVRPSIAPSVPPSARPSLSRTVIPTRGPTAKPTRVPTQLRTESPTREPSHTPTMAISKAPGEDRSHLIVGYIAAGLLGLWLLYALRRWCQYKLEGVQSDANRTLYVESMGEKAKPRFPIVAYIVSFFCTIHPVEVDFITIETAVASASATVISDTYNGIGAYMEGPDLEANTANIDINNNKRTEPGKKLKGSAEEGGQLADNTVVSPDTPHNHTNNSIEGESSTESYVDVILSEESSYGSEYASSISDHADNTASEEENGEESEQRSEEGSEEEGASEDVSVVYSLSTDGESITHSSAYSSDGHYSNVHSGTE